MKYKVVDFYYYKRNRVVENFNLYELALEFFRSSSDVRYRGVLIGCALYCDDSLLVSWGEIK